MFPLRYRWQKLLCLKPMTLLCLFNGVLSSLLLFNHVSTFLRVGKSHQFPATPPVPHPPAGDWDSTTSLTLCYTRTIPIVFQIRPPPPSCCSGTTPHPLCSGTCPLRYSLTPSYNFLCYSSRRWLSATAGEESRCGVGLGQLPVANTHH